MGAARWKLGCVGSAFFVLAAFAQPVAADPIYYLVQGSQYSPGNGIGTFIIPSVAQGLLFYLNADDRSVEITLTGLCNAVYRRNEVRVFLFGVSGTWPL